MALLDFGISLALDHEPLLSLLPEIAWAVRAPTCHPAEALNDPRNSQEGPCPEKLVSHSSPLPLL